MGIGVPTLLFNGEVMTHEAYTLSHIKTYKAAISNFTDHLAFRLHMEGYSPPTICTDARSNLRGITL